MRVSVLVWVMFLAVAVTAAPLGTEFTYQGVLSDGGTPASGVFDFRCFLYNADAGGSQVGPVFLIEDVPVAEGRITTQLDFGAVFDGAALWLEVGVRDGGSTGSYTVLQPRQELTAAPFAQHSKAADSALTAVTAGHATTAGDADTLDGQNGAYYLAWSNFVGIPGDIADGDDDTLADLSCSPDEIAAWNGSAWNCSADDDTPYTRTYVVGPVGTPTDNGTALRNAIAAIIPPTSREEAVLLVLEPGTFALGTTGIEMWGWMTIEGAGEDLTLITGAACGPSYDNPTIRSTSSRSGLRGLTVENTCDNPAELGIGFGAEGSYATLERVALWAHGDAKTNIAFRSMSSNLKMSHVAVTAEQGSTANWGLFNGGNGAVLEFVTAYADGGSNATAIANNAHDLTLRHGVTKADGSGSCTALNNTGDNLWLENVVADGSPLTCAGSGVHSQNASGTLIDVRAEGGIAIFWASSSLTRKVTMHDVRAEGITDGIHCLALDGSLNLDIDGSWIQGGLTSITNQSSSCGVWVRSSHVDPVVSGAVTCIGVYNGSTFFPNTCS